MRTLTQLRQILLPSLALVILASAAFAQSPSSPSPAVSDQQAGSVLFFNFFTSNANNPRIQDTEMSITNTNPIIPAVVHFFFVDGSTCAVLDLFTCLTPNQTSSFLASDFDPGTTGYVVAVATDSDIGCPISFNYLIGSEYVKLASGHAASLGAETFAALYPGNLPNCDMNSLTAVLSFDGVSYDRAPSVLAVDNIRSLADGNSVLLIVNSLGGNLAIGGATLGLLFGVLYDDAENPLSFTFTGGCQFKAVLSNSFPVTTPPFSVFIPSGRTGWMKFFARTETTGILGAVINFNKKADKEIGAFNGGRNLHKLTFTTVRLTIPVIPLHC